MVVIFRSLQGENLEDYSIRLAQAWRIGQKGLDNGVIFLVFLDDRRMRLEVGYGLEATLTDAIAGSIIRDVVAPRFRAGRLADGIEAGLDAIAAAIAGTYRRPERSARGASGQPVTAGVVVALVLLALTAMVVLRASAQARRLGWTTDRGRWRVGRGGSGWSWGGGSFGGSGSGGGNGGGDFSGGGGSFGGGGASGNW